MSTKIKNPISGRLINVNGSTYRKLVKLGHIKLKQYDMYDSEELLELYQQNKSLFNDDMSSDEVKKVFLKLLNLKEDKDVKEAAVGTYVIESIDEYDEGDGEGEGDFEV